MSLVVGEVPVVLDLDEALEPDLEAVGAGDVRAPNTFHRGTNAWFSFQFIER